MHDTNLGARPMDIAEHRTSQLDGEKGEVVSTHVLVEQEQVEKLRELSRRTRIAQSEYLREAVNDLLAKYHKLDQR